MTYHHSKTELEITTIENGKTITERIVNSHTEIPNCVFVLCLVVVLIIGAALSWPNEWLRDLLEFALRIFNN